MTASPLHSRIASARRRAKSVKRAAVAAAATVFVAAAVLARAAHPGSAESSNGETASTSAVTPAQADDARSDPFFSTGSVGPADNGAVPQASTHTS